MEKGRNVMNMKFEGKTAVVVGATGGLGSSFVKAFAKKKLRLLLVGRNEEKLRSLAATVSGDITITTADITNPESLLKLNELIGEWSDRIDYVVNASGHDVRKSLEDYSIEDIHNTLDINLLGTILLTKTMLPLMKNNEGSFIAHIGGFADGRMAFPYYSVDVATRAGMFSFIESVNREMALEGSKARVCFFCPSPADTEAERPFHPLWKKMGIKILSADNVAEALISTIGRGRQVSIMGGPITIFFARLNSIMPKLADSLAMKNYGRMLKDYLYGEKISSSTGLKKKDGLLNKIAIILVVMSFILYGLIFVVPFLPLTLAQKAVAIPILVGTGEATWWTGVAIAGKQVVTKYRSYLNPCNWTKCHKQNA